MKRFLAWAAFPALFTFMVIRSYYESPEAYYLWIKSHTSALEAGTGLILILVLCISILTVGLARTRGDGLLKRWLVVFTLAVFFFAGEDQNWGQHYFNTTVPDFFMEHNKEKETNLHNISSWFNQKPRLATEIWIIIAGILVPLGWSWPRKRTAGFVPAILWPAKRLVPFAVLTVVMTLPDRLWKWFEISTGGLEHVRFSEIQELWLCWFMLLYILAIRAELQARPAAPAATPAPAD